MVDERADRSKRYTGGEPHDMTGMPERCPLCDGELEEAKPRVVKERQQAEWWFFDNGSYIVGKPGTPAPKRCAKCRCGWLFEPHTEKVVRVVV